MVGSGTVRVDDPSLTTRAVDGPDPVRVVLGAAPTNARVHPCLEIAGELDEVLDRLGGEGIVQLLVEGGADVAGRLHRAGLVDRYVVYVAPKLAGGDDGVPMFAGPGAASMSDIWSGRLRSVDRFGDDVRFVIEPEG
jgi:diaminohydroxyphosphoribosylaminopyrimidine deaminase/5-amino-6-(5-phosphoribosylamino)uracil reductase